MTSFQSLAAIFRHRVEESPTRPAFEFPEGDGWRTVSWAETGDKARAYACGLRALGLEDEGRVVILSNTRVEWIYADLAINNAGGATTTIYPSTTPEGCEFIVNDSGATLAFVEDKSQVAKLQSCRAQMPQLKQLILIEGQVGEDEWVISLDDLAARGRAYDEAHPGAYDEVIDRLTPQSLSTLIYTSGTTGQPKGVELVHDAWVYVTEALDETKLLSIEDKQYLWLPLSHVFGKMLISLSLRFGFPTTVDGRVNKIVDNLAYVKPTFIAAVPRIFEKVYNKVVNGARQAGGLKYKIFKRSMSAGLKVSKLRQMGREPRGALALQYKVADKLVFSKLRARFGGRLRFFISGSAPLNRDIAEFFHAAGLLILEGYGLTESSAASFCNVPQSNRFGTVGPPLPGTAVKFLEDGEILIQSRGVMRGYYNNPEATADVLQDGWLCTGDIGELDEAGHLKITDRKKELIKTSGGKYIAPQKLVGDFKAICPFVSQMIVHGNRRNFCVALITMDEEGILAWAEANGLGGKGYAELAEAPAVIALFQGYLDQLNAGLARYETIKRFALLPEDFSVEAGTITPSLKVKRKAVEARYAQLLDGFYAESLQDI